ncbi:MAG: hypothetical protein GY845_03460, partial [Planctomycetes bacterium]|nr:hypothetical protein [Planctomycetota bacterium]
MRGPNVTDTVKRLILEIRQEIIRDTGKDPKAPQVLAELAARLEQQGKAHSSIPSLRKVQVLLQEARDIEIQQPRTERQQDLPWSLGSLDRFPIPSEALPVVTTMWRVSNALGQPFTIREAKWLARYYLAHREVNIEQRLKGLFFMMRRYAIREQICSLLGIKPCDTTDIDAMAFMGDEMDIACLLGRVPSEDEAPDQLDAKARELSRVTLLDTSSLKTMAELQMFSWEQMLDMNIDCEESYFDTSDTKNWQYVYAHLLTFAAESDAWKTKLSPEERLSFAKELQGWAMKYDLTDYLLQTGKLEYESNKQ